jgi:hypothetical protein
MLHMLLGADLLMLSRSSAPVPLSEYIGKALEQYLSTSEKLIRNSRNTIKYHCYDVVTRQQLFLL